MEDKIYEITISKQEYDDLKLGDYLLTDILEDMKKSLEDATLNWDKKSLIFKDDKISRLFNRYISKEYSNKIEKLKKDKDGENNER